VETSGNPVVYGYYDAGADKTVIIYMMYDTQPVDEPGWIVPPLEGHVVEMPPFGKCLVARGAINTKGELAAFLNACESITAVGEEIPLNLIFVAEGEEGCLTSSCSRPRCSSKCSSIYLKTFSLFITNSPASHFRL
jgi:acetylornithine deacetylase/succinyl-diaminopimelate desuccinylase-like protein